MKRNGKCTAANPRIRVGLERGLERLLQVLRHRQTKHRLVELGTPRFTLVVIFNTLRYALFALETEMVLRRRRSFAMSIQTQAQSNLVFSELRVTLTELDSHC